MNGVYIGRNREAEMGVVIKKLPSSSLHVIHKDYNKDERG